MAKKTTKKVIEKSGGAKKLGAPTKYTEDIPEKLLEYFCIDLDREVKNKDGKIVAIKPNRLPTVEGFCASVMIAKSTFHEWVKKYPSLSNALGIAKQFQINHLMQHTLEGTYNASFARFLAINISEYREQVEQANETEITVNVTNHGLNADQS